LRACSRKSAASAESPRIIKRGSVYYRVEAEKASEESLTLSNGEFANKTACTEQEYALISRLAIDWCFDIWTRQMRQVETLCPENCILRDRQLYAYYYEAVPCVIYLEDTDKAYTIRTEEETRIDSHDRKPYTEMIYTKLRPCRLTKEGFAIRDKALFWCRKTAKGDLTISDGVEKITNYAFEDCSQITSITVPISTNRIYPKAFCNCRGLTSVTLPDKVWLSNDAFEGCCQQDKWRPIYHSSLKDRGFCWMHISTSGLCVWSC